jgi:putative ABC transport system permease protein
MLGMLSVAVAAVMLVACVNVTNLLLGHAEARSGEFAVRAALGGGSWRLQRQILTECSALAVVGGAVGLAVTPALIRTLLKFYPDPLPRVGEIGLDAGVLVAGICVALVAGVVATVPIIRRALSRDLSRDLRQGGRTGSIRGRQRTGRLLIASQVAMSVALLFAATLLLRTFHTLQTTNPGFASGNMTTFQVIAPSARYPTLGDAQTYLRDADQALLALPGVRAIAAASEMPYTGNADWEPFVIREHGDHGRDNPQVRVATVSPNYWDMLGVPVRSGRVFLPSDTYASPRVVVVNDTLAARFYPGQEAVGRLIEFNKQTWQIIGVVGAMRMLTVAEPPEPELYLSSQQDLQRGWYMIVKSHGPIAPPLPDIRRALRSVDPTIAVTEGMTMEARVARAVAPQRFRATLVMSLCAIALVLSAVGIYGVIADAVSRQTREIGIRLALGLDHTRVRRGVLRSALWTAGSGAMIGAGLAVLAGKGLAGYLIGVRPDDPVALGGSVLVLAIWAAGAAFFPARRASRIDPLVALRHE